MATTVDISNLVNCGVGVALGTGEKGCEAVLQAVTSLVLTPRGFKFSKTEDITTDSTYFKQLQAEGKLIVLKGIKEFTTNREANVTQTDADGTISVTRKGLYAFNVKFQKGFAFQAALSSLDSFGVYDISFIDQVGNILGTVAADGSFKGITTGMIDADGLDFATFSTKLMQGFTFQFLDTDEVNTDYFFISNKELSWKPERLDGVNEVVLSFTAVPADLATSISVKAKLKTGGSAFTGAVFGDFNFKINGTTSNPTAGDDSATAGTYLLTVAALATNDVVTIDLYDNTNNREAIDIDGDLYKSVSLSSVVV